MDLSPLALLVFARETIADPRAAARRVMAVQASMETRWTALALMAIASTILFHVAIALLPLQEGAEPPAITPLASFTFQSVGLLLTAVLTWRVGQARGGTGSLPDTVSLLAWLQFILLLVQVFQILAEVLLPPLAALIGFAGVGIFFWLFSNFVAELHGFRSVGSVFAGIVGMIFAIALLLSLVLVGIGVQP